MSDNAYDEIIGKIKSRLAEKDETISQLMEQLSKKDKELEDLQQKLTEQEAGAKKHEDLLSKLRDVLD